MGSCDLAAEGAEAEGVEQAPVADLAAVGDALARPRLGAFVEEDDAGAVDDVRLHTGEVQHLLDLGNSDHVVVGRPPYLQPTPGENKLVISRNSIDRLVSARWREKGREKSGVERLESREDIDAVLYKKFPVIRNKEIVEGTISTVGQGGRFLVQLEERLTESRQAEDEMDLNRVVAAVAVETEGTEGAAHAVETVHVAFVPVVVSVVLALDEEVRRQ
ncbi:hypothetical protein BHM03_00028982 [Ensete ventricosum]|nr:hypothetical protein BHM03_00028982 [Ensete ventricosum]